MIDGANRWRIFCSCSDVGEIACLRLDSRSGRLEHLSTAQVLSPPEQTKSVPLAAATSGKFLYAAARTSPATVLTLQVSGSTGMLSVISQSPTPGSIAYLSLSKCGAWLLAASYPDSLVVIHSVDRKSGHAGPVVQTLPGITKAHCVVLDDASRYCYVAALGEDRIRRYSFDSKRGVLSELGQAAVRARANCGPRHLEIHGRGRVLYCLNETDGTIDVYTIDSSDGTLEYVQTVALPTPAWPRPGNVRAADLAITPAGRFLYATERTSSTVTMFYINEFNGCLTVGASYPTELSPRGIRVTPDGRCLLVAGELSGNIAVYTIDTDHGRLSRTDRTHVGGGANWIEIVDRAIKR